MPSALALRVNDISGNARDYKRQLDSFADPYEAIRTLYSLNRQRLILDYIPSYDTNDNPNPTIRAVLFKPVITNFADKADHAQSPGAGHGKKLPYSCWMQPKPAPLVFYIPGLGACRFDRSTLAYADMMYRHGYSVVAFSNPFQKEFMEIGFNDGAAGLRPGGLRRRGERAQINFGRPAEMAGRQNHRHQPDRRFPWRLFHFDDRRARSCRRTWRTVLRPLCRGQSATATGPRRTIAG